MKKRINILLFLVFCAFVLHGQNNSINLNIGYGVVDGGVDGTVIGAEYKIKIKNYFNFGIGVDCFYGTSNRPFFGSGEGYKNKVMIISEEYISGDASFSAFETKYKKIVENKGIIKLGDKISKYLYVPITFLISKDIKVDKRLEITPSFGVGIMYYHSKSLFKGIEGPEVIESSYSELNGKQIGLFFDYYYRTIVKAYSFGITQRYNFSKYSFVGLKSKFSWASNDITGFLQLSFVFGTKF